MKGSRSTIRGRLTTDNRQPTTVRGSWTKRVQIFGEEWRRAEKH
jgi:hypothetical protein